MTQDRIANWGESEAAARYQTGDTDPDGGDFIVARDLDGQRMLLKFDFAANEWQYAGDVDMGGGDINSVGTARVDALETDQASIGNVVAKVSNEEQDTPLPDSASTKLEWHTIEKEDAEVFSVDLDNNEIDVLQDGDYIISYSFRVSGNSSWSTGDSVVQRIFKNGSFETGLFEPLKISTNREVIGPFTLYLNDLNENDTIHVEIEQRSGSEQMIDSNRFSNQLSFYRVS